MDIPDSFYPDFINKRGMELINCATNSSPRAPCNEN